MTTAGTPERLVAATAGNRWVKAIEFTARKAKATANTGNVYVGTAAQQNKVLEPGDVWGFEAVDGKAIDLYEILIDAATSGDGVLWTAIA